MRTGAKLARGAGLKKLHAMFPEVLVGLVTPLLSRFSLQPCVVNLTTLTHDTQVKLDQTERSPRRTPPPLPPRRRSPALSPTGNTRNPLLTAQVGPC